MNPSSTGPSEKMSILLSIRWLIASGTSLMSSGEGLPEVSGGCLSSEKGWNWLAAGALSVL